MNRRTVIASVGTALPLFAGCAESGTGIRLEPTSIQVVGSADDGWTWDVRFTLVYELSGLSKDEGLYGVVSHLIDERGTERGRVEHGDLAWTSLSTDERTEKQNTNEPYRGTRRETVSIPTGRFPHWIVFTADRVVKSGYPFVSVYGATTDRPTGLPTESDGGERNSTVPDQQRSENETATDRGRISVTNDDWERIRLRQYLSFPPADGIANADETTNESDANASSDHDPSTATRRTPPSSR